MKVTVLPRVLNYLENLVLILYEKEYFGFMETSSNYVQELLDNIETTLPILSSKPAPKYFEKYGKNMEYAVLRKSKHTQWYVFFKVYKKDGEDLYQVHYIANNHTVAQYL